MLKRNGNGTLTKVGELRFTPWVNNRESDSDGRSGFKIYSNNYAPASPFQPYFNASNRPRQERSTIW